MDDSQGIACVIYGAKSTEDRRGSIPDQLRECRAAIGADPSRRLVAEYTDEAFSAFRRNRGPGLRDAMQHAEELAKENGAAELWAQHSDRLARGDGRSARHAVEIALWALKRDVIVHTLQDPDTFRDLLYAVVTGQRNHEDSRRKGLAVAAGQRRAATRGDYVGHKPDGYRVVVELDERNAIQRRLELDPARQPVIELIFRMALRGKRTGAIARALNDAGWATNPLVGRGSPAKWTAERIAGLLRNQRYAGIAVVKGEVVARGNWPAYISERQYARIRVLVSQRKPTKAPRQLETYLLARLATCGRCGSRLYALTGKEHVDGTFLRRYVCKDHWQGRYAGRCSAPPVDADMFEAMFVSSMGALLLDGLEDDPPPLVESQRHGAAVITAGERQALLDAIVEGKDQRLYAALERLFVRMQPEAAFVRQAAISQRRARQLEAVPRFQTWIEHERTGRTEDSREEARKLNRLLHRWFSSIAIAVEETSVEIVAQRRPTAGEPSPSSRGEAHLDRREWTRLARVAERSHRRYSRWDDAEIIGALQAWADFHGRSPRWSDWAQPDSYRPHPATVQLRFGGWTVALRKAGLQPYISAVPRRKRVWDDADILKALTDWTAKYGHSPLASAWLQAAPERPCTNTVGQHFGSWQAGIAAAGLEHIDGRLRRRSDGKGRPD